MDFNSTNKKLVVITGASSGIGEALAKKFNQEGYPLLLLARRLDKLNNLGLDNCLSRKVDVTDKDALSFAIKEAEEVFGPVDCIINNAGVMLLGNIDTQNTSEWKSMFDVNVMGLLNGIHCVAKSMKKNKTGTIINISSVAGKALFPRHTAYCGTKFAVHAISEGLRQELSEYNIRVTTIAPGAIETELLGHTTASNLIEEYKDWRTNAGININVDNLANIVLYVYNQPQNVCIRELVVADTKQEK